MGTAIVVDCCRCGRHRWPLVFVVIQLFFVVVVVCDHYPLTPNLFVSHPSVRQSVSPSSQAQIELHQQNTQ